MNAPRPDVSVVIVSWNTRAMTLACLQSLAAAARRVTWDAWVVDNASADDSVEAVRRELPDVHVIANPTNLGFAAANNQGILASCGRYVLLLNSDTVMAPGSLDVLVDLAQAHPRAGVVGAILLNPDGTYQSGPTPFPSVWNELLSVTGIGRRLSFRGYPSKPEAEARHVQRADYIGGACMLARREAIDGVGGLDEGYFMYGEESDWCWRMQDAGWEVWYTPNAEITHFGGQSTRQVRDAMTVALYRSKVRFFRRHRGAVSAMILTGIVIAVTQLRWALRRALGRSPAGVAIRPSQLWPSGSSGDGRR